MKLLTQEVLRRLPALGSQTAEDPIAQVKFFTPDAEWTGYATEGQEWTLDKEYNGSTKTRPNGVIYLVTGAGGAGLYNPEQQDKPETWQAFTDKFISKVHSFTQVNVNGKRLELRQISETGAGLDRAVVTK